MGVGHGAVGGFFCWGRWPGVAGRGTVGTMALRYDHVVFDLDGTLIDSRLDLAAAVNHVRRGLGMSELSVENVCEYVGEGARVLVQRSLGIADSARIEPALQTFLEYYGEHLLDHTRPYAGVVDVLDALARAGVTLSVLTNKPEDKSRAILEGLGLLDRFIAVVGGDSVPSRKPDPAGIECLRARTATPPERLLLVGDSDVDMRTAAAAGVAFCGVAWGFKPEKLRSSAPPLWIAKPAELLDLVVEPPAPTTRPPNDPTTPTTR